ncbi:HAD family hydrolase, partial [Thermodesulfobacteriota bacterium]
MLKNDLISKYIRPLTPHPTSLRQSGNLKAKVKCILFDVYGTLFISESGDISIAKRESQQIDKLKNLLLQFRIDQNPQSILRTFFDAIDQQHKQQRAEGIDFPEVEIDQIWKLVLKVDDLNTIRAFALEFELIANPVYPMPHLEKMLTSCRKSNILMGIISNAQFYTPYLFKWFLGADPENLGFHPDLMFFSYTFGYAKPST